MTVVMHGHFGPPVEHEKVSGAGVPIRHAARTGWKACATGRKQNCGGHRPPYGFEFSGKDAGRSANARRDWLGTWTGAVGLDLTGLTE